MTNPGNIYKTIHAIQSEITAVPKNGIGPATQGAYKFVAVDDILGIVKPLLDKYGVIVVPTLLDHGYHYVQALAKDDARVPREATTAWVKYQFQFVDTSDGSSINTVVISEGADNSDKATRKATTSAWKIALIQTFALITGEVDPDAVDDKNTNTDTAGSPANPKIEKARGAATAKPSSNPLQGKRDELQKVAADQGRAFNDVLELGDRILGQKRADWTNDPASLDKLIAAVKAGEV